MVRTVWFSREHRKQVSADHPDWFSCFWQAVVQHHVSASSHTLSVILRSIKVWAIDVFHINWVPHTPLDWSLSSNCRVCFSVATVEKVTTAKENVSIKARLIWPCCLEGVNWGTKTWLTLLAPVILTNACKSTLRHSFRAGAACFSTLHQSSHPLITKRFKDALDKCHFTTEPWTGIL